MLNREAVLCLTEIKFHVQQGSTFVFNTECKFQLHSVHFNNLQHY